MDAPVEQFFSPDGWRTHNLILERRSSDARYLPEVLDLQGNAITTLAPQSVELLRGYREINLGGNQLTEIPEEFATLTDLRILDLSNNELTALPEALYALRLLKILDISGNTELREVSEKIGQLKRLAVVNLSFCGLTRLPGALFRLPALRELHSNGNQLADLPAQIGESPSIKVLALAQTGLKRFPAEILRLPSLTALQLDDNAITELPGDLGRLHNLELLELSNNGLRSIPPGIARMNQLQTLVLSRNEIAALPAELSTLRNLRELNLSSNKITDIPVEFGKCAADIKLVLGGNPLNDIVQSVAAQGTSALLNYLRGLAQSAEQYEAKLLLIGEGGVGKSTLIAALRGEQFRKDRLTTHGIELGTLKLPHPAKRDVKLTLNSWDFGGQEVYRITHQFFFSRRALYLLVWKPREGQEQNSIEDWCRRIRLRTGPDARIIVVATHADERRPEFDYEYLRAKYPDLLVGNVAVDSESGRGIDELRELIAVRAAQLPQMGELLNRSWSDARTRILEERRPHISRFSFERICADAGLDEESSQTLAVLLHDLGHIIHYADDDGLRNLVVLQPEWLTKAIGFVLEDEATRQAGGVLQHDRLRDIWSAPAIVGEAGYPQEFHPYFLRLMEKFDITYRLAEEPSSLVAQLVPYTRPQTLQWPSTDRNLEVRTLRLVCRLADEAPGIVAWLTVRNHQFSVGKHWRRGVVLVHEQYASQAVIELAPNNVDLNLTVTGPAPEYLFHLLRDGIEELIRHRWKGLDYEFRIPCGRLVDKERGTRCQGYFTYGALIKFRQRHRATIVCHACVEESEVAELLTGFAESRPPIDQVLGELIAAQRETTEVVRRVDDRTAFTGAMTAAALRHVLTVLSSEVDDTPRLFTFTPKDRHRVIDMVSTRQAYTLTLWCEQPGHEHLVTEAAYDFKPAKEWVETVGPYVRFVARVLQTVVPVATAVYGLTQAPADLAAQRAELDLAKTLADKFPKPAQLAITAKDEPEAQGLTRAEGAGLRALRQLLLKLDPVQRFGGLRKVYSVSGDLLWVCETHYRQYDPGLPELSYTLPGHPDHS